MCKVLHKKVEGGEERGKKLATEDAEKLKKLKKDTGRSEKDCITALRRTIPIGDAEEAKNILRSIATSSSGNVSGGGGAPK